MNLKSNTTNEWPLSVSLSWMAMTLVLSSVSSDFFYHSSCLPSPPPLLWLAFFLFPLPASSLVLLFPLLVIGICSFSSPPDWWKGVSMRSSWCFWGTVERYPTWWCWLFSSTSQRQMSLLMAQLSDRGYGFGWLMFRSCLQALPIPVCAFFPKYHVLEMFLARYDRILSFWRLLYIDCFWWMIVFFQSTEITSWEYSMKANTAFRWKYMYQQHYIYVKWIQMDCV